MRVIKLAAFTHNNPCCCLRASPLRATMSKRPKEKKEGEEDKTNKPRAKAAKTKATDAAPASNANAPAPNAAADKIAKRKEAMAMGLGEIQAKYYSPEVVSVAKTKVKEVGFSFCFLIFCVFTPCS